jgi:hypothetical protein
MFADTIEACSQFVASHPLCLKTPTPNHSNHQTKQHITAKMGPQAAPVTQGSIVPAIATLTAMPFRFMDLPPELRIHIYEELVAVGKVFYTPDWYDVDEGTRFKDYKQYRKPSLSILRVSKAVHEEAEDHYLGRNLFVLPSMFEDMQPCQQHIETSTVRKAQPWLFSNTALLKVKRISVSLCLRNSNVPSIMGRSEWADSDIDSPGLFDSMTPAQRRDYAHDLVLEWHGNYRNNMSYSISEFRNLEAIEVDLTNAYCPMGCCRTFYMTWALAMRHVKKVRILGSRNDEEKDMVLTSWSDELEVTPEELKVMYEIETT